MKHLLLILLIIASIGHGYASAQVNKARRVLFIVDCSSSMSLTGDNKTTRFQQAGKIVLGFVDSITKKDKDAEFGLRVYGHQFPAQQKNCTDTKLEVTFSKSNYTQLQLRLEHLRPYGVSPVSLAIKEATMYDLDNPSKYDYSVVLITDGGESCDGNICEMKDVFRSRRIKFEPYIIGDGNNPDLAAKYSCYAASTNSPAQTQLVVNVLVNKLDEEIKNGSSATDSSLYQSIDQSADTSFGYILITDMITVKNLELLYFDNGNYKPLAKLDLDNLFKGQRIRIKTGGYKITYQSARTNSKFIVTREFKILDEMVTEVQLK